MNESNSAGNPAQGKAKPPSESNPCGECTACCTIMRVDALNKPSHHPCQHICTNGCAIYQNKPKECDVWECAWKSGWIEGDERRRPDKLGVMFEFRIVGGRVFLWVYEVWRGAFQSDKVKYLLGRLSKQSTLVMCKFGSMEVTADPPILEFLRAHGCGTLDLPLVPSTPVVDDNGAMIGHRIVRKSGDGFEITIRRNSSQAL